jgi:hypothetical protein
MSRSGRTTCVVALVLGLAVTAVPAAQPAGTDRDRPSAAAKKKRCKKGKVRQRVGKRTRCVKARKALPKPRAFDTRRTATTYLLGADLSRVRDRRGRRARSLPKLLRKVHPRAERALLAATKAGLARFDRRAALGARAAQDGCTGSGSISSTFDAGGGLSVDMTTTAGPDASLQLGMESRNGNRQVRIEIEFPGCDRSRLESCPTAEGIVNGRDDRRIGIRASVVEDGRVTWSQGMTLQGETTLRGVVDDDAKLDFFEPHNTEQATLTLGGSGRGFAPVTIRTLVQRITRVDMPAGEYVLGPSIVDVSISSEGFGGAERRATEQDIASKMRREADKQFRDIIEKAMRRFRTIEDGWNRPNTCATIEFTPAPNSKTLHRGETGTLTARVQAKPGGAPSGAKWTRVSEVNAPFSPVTATGNPATFNHGAVTDAGPGIAVAGAFKAVSKAGVAQATWTQPTEGLVVNTIAGTFSGTWSAGGSVYTWTGTATFSRVLPGPGANGPFQLTSGSYTVTASGLDGTGATGCTQSGTKLIAMTAGDLTVSGQLPERLPPYDYSGSIIGLGPQSMTVALSNCPDPNSPSQATVGLAFTALKMPAGEQSADGIDFSGTASEPFPGLTADWSWSLRGAP